VQPTESAEAGEAPAEDDDLRTRHAPGSPSILSAMRFAYRRELAGGFVLTVLDHDSRLLADNPLGDPTQRSHPVLVPPGGGAGLPLVVLLVGYTGFNHKVVNRGNLWQPNLPERIAAAMDAGRVPPAVVFWPSAETRLGGSQYVDSPGTGPYARYVVEELVPFVEAELGCGGDGRRVVAGKSSGGFGALHLAMRHPGAFRGAASHSGDMGFDVSHVRGFSDALDAWSRHGGPAAFLEALPTLPELGHLEHAGVECLAMASCYSPNPESPLGVDLPMDPDSGEPRPEVFARWLAFDPVRRLEEDGPEAEALRALDGRLWLDCGERDEFALHWGLRRLLPRLERCGIPHHAEFHPGGHFGIDERYERSLPFLLEGL